MTTSTTPRLKFGIWTALIALCGLGGLGGLGASAGCATDVQEGALEQGELDVQAQELKLRPPTVPSELTVPAGNRLAFYLDAVGQQVYVCQATATGFGYVLQAPDADLLKPNGRIAGSHYAGPTWEYLDGSTVVGARVNGVTVDPTAIPWLLLSAPSHAGQGKMSKVSFIHRVDTTGGLAPGGCDAAHLGNVQGIDYTARYYFYEPAPSCAH